MQLKNRKKLVANQRRYEGVHNRIADVCVTFCEKGGTAVRVSSDFYKKSERAVLSACSDVVGHQGLEPWTVRL